MRKPKSWIGELPERTQRKQLASGCIQIGVRVKKVGETFVIEAVELTVVEPKVAPMRLTPTVNEPLSP